MEKNKGDFQITINVDVSANNAYESINNVSAWWTENLKGDTHHLNDEFEVQFGDVHFSRQKIVEQIPGKKVVWLVTESRLSFVENMQEWTDTRIVFEILQANDQIQIRFTHIGLVPQIECYGGCSNAWSEYIGDSLLQLVNTGKGEPTRKS